MVRFVSIVRLSDGLPLVSSQEDGNLGRDFPEFKRQYKIMLNELSSLQRAAEGEINQIELGYFSFIILLDPSSDLALLSLCEKHYPKKLAGSLLGDLKEKFLEQFTPSMIKVPGLRPYAFISFDSTLEKIKADYRDVRAKSNLERLHSDLADVTKIMHTNITGVLERGSKLETMSLLSNNLSEDSRKYLRHTKKMNLQLLWRQHGPIAIFIGALMMFLFIYWKWF